MTLRPLDCQRGEFIEESDSGRGSIAAIEQCDNGFLGQTHNDAVHRCIQKSIAVSQRCEKLLSLASITLLINRDFIKEGSTLNQDSICKQNSNSIEL